MSRGSRFQGKSTTFPLQWAAAPKHPDVHQGGQSNAIGIYLLNGGLWNRRKLGMVESTRATDTHDQDWLVDNLATGMDERWLREDQGCKTVASFSYGRSFGLSETISALRLGGLRWDSCLPTQLSCSATSLAIQRDGCHRFSVCKTVAGSVFIRIECLYTTQKDLQGHQRIDVFPRASHLGLDKALRFIDEVPGLTHPPIHR